jgi:hypothetical protein
MSLVGAKQTFKKKKQGAWPGRGHEGEVFFSKKICT